MTILKSFMFLLCVCAFIWTLFTNQHIIGNGIRYVKLKYSPFDTLKWREMRLGLLKEALNELHTNFSRIPHLKLAPKKEAEWCALYDELGHLPRVVMSGVWSHDNVEGVTLQAQVSADKNRLQMFENVLLGWPGPVSLTLYLNNGKENLLEDLKNLPIILDKSNLDLHLAADRSTVYPQNALRQISLVNVRTEFAFHADADFIPSRGLYEHLLNITSKQKWPAKKLLVIPAMEHLTSDSYRPINKIELLKMWRENKVQPFKDLVSTTQHHFTNFSKWVTANNSYVIPRHQERFEPYVVFRTKEVPPYDERFTGGLNDKISHILKMVALGFTMEVESQYFVIHMHHTRKDGHAPERPHFARCNFNIYAKHVADLCKENPTGMKRILWEINIRHYDKSKVLSKDCPSQVDNMHFQRKEIAGINIKVETNVITSLGHK